MSASELVLAVGVAGEHILPALFRVCVQVGELRLGAGHDASWVDPMPPAEVLWEHGEVVHHEQPLVIDLDFSEQALALGCNDSDGHGGDCRPRNGDVRRVRGAGEGRSV